jgi:hypothetical protein
VSKAKTYFQDPKFVRRQRLLLAAMLACYCAAAVLLTMGVVGLFGEFDR